MTEFERKKQNKRRIIGALFAIATIGFLVTKVLHNPDEVWSIFNESNKTLLIFLILLQVVSFFFNALISKHLLYFTGHKTTFKNNMVISIANEFGNWMLPVAGGSITSYIIYRRIHIPPSVVIFIESIWSVVNFFTFLIFFIVSALIIPRTYLSLIPKLALVIMSVIAGVVIGIWYILSKIRSGDVFKKIVTKFVNAVKFIVPVNFNAEDVAEKIDQSGKQFVENFGVFFSKPASVVYVCILYFLYFSTDIAMLHYSFVAFGVQIPFAVITFGLILSLILSLITLFPGNPGVTETSLAIIFHAFGVPLHNAILAVVVFRIATYWLWMPLSVYVTFGHKTHHKHHAT